MKFSELNVMQMQKIFNQLPELNCHSELGQTKTIEGYVFKSVEVGIYYTWELEADSIGNLIFGGERMDDKESEKNLGFSVGFGDIRNVDIDLL